MRIAHTLALAGLCLVIAAPASAIVVYDFTTNEPFAGGDLRFIYEAPDFITANLTVEAASLFDATPTIERVFFEPGCPALSIPCAQIRVVANLGFFSTIANRYFAPGAFATPGIYTSIAGSAARLEVSSPPAIPEPLTWSMMLAGFLAIGAAARHHRRANELPIINSLRQA